MARMTVEKKRLIGNFLSLSFLQAANYLIPLATLPYLVKAVGPGKYGILAFATATMAYFISITDYGFGLTATREVSAHRGDPSRIDAVVSTVLGLKAAMLAACGAVLALLVLTVGEFRAESAVFLGSYLSVIGQAFTLNWLFQGMEDAKPIVLANLAGRILYLLSLFAVVRAESDYVYVPLLNGGAAILSAIVLAIMAVRRHSVGWRTPSFADMASTLRSGLSIFVAQFVPNLYNNASYIILGFSSSHATLGVFAAANKLVDVFISGGYVLSNTFFPYLTKKPEGFAKAKRIFLLGGGLLSAAAFLASDLLVEILLSEGFLESAPLVRLLSPSIFLVFAYLCFSTNYLVSRQKDDSVRNVSIGVSVAGLALAAALIAWKEDWGAAWAILVSRFLLAAFTYRLYLAAERKSV